MSARNELGMERLFDPGSPELGHSIPHQPSNIYQEVCGLASHDPYAALRTAAMSLVRHKEPDSTERQVRDYVVERVLPQVDDTALVTVYIACMTYDAELHKDAAKDLYKFYAGLQESHDVPHHSEVAELYSASILLAQASPGTDVLEILSRSALLRAEVIGGGIGNAAQVLFNLAFELYSDDGGIKHRRYYEALCATFKDIAEEYTWYTAEVDISPRDFANLVLRHGKRKVVPSGIVDLISGGICYQPQLDFSAPVDATM